MGRFGPHPNPVPWYPLPYMQLFLDHQRLRYSTTRVAQMRTALAYFGVFAQGENIRHPEELERMHILRFQAWMIQDAKTRRGEPLNVGYQNHIMYNVRLWFRWLESEGHITEQPWQRIKIAYPVKTSKKLEDADVLAIFAAHRASAFSVAPFVFHRREMILALLFAWGLTLKELQTLTVAHLDMRQDSVSVRFAQGSRVKHMPYGPEMKQVTMRWLQQRPRYAKANEDALLIDTTGQLMSSRNIQKVLTELGERAGVSLTPTRLRDTYGFRLVNSDMKKRAVRDLLGLERTESVAHYDPKDPKVQEKLKAAREIEDDLAELLGHKQQHEYRRMT